jgi:outer membrane receptor protein involved in Fe transport
MKLRRKGFMACASVTALALTVPFAVHAQTGEQEEDSSGANVMEEIIVTAQRRDESILDVPISIAAFSQDMLDHKGIRNMEDLARQTPSLALSQGFSGIKYISIRGLSSSVGATMTGVYLDDTPIQVRSLVLQTNFYPALYDLERVEVLRGPQGTLFGAGAMGGAVRFISAKPSLNQFSGNVRSELAFTEGGDPSYEAGGAMGGPIVEDVLGYRVSAYYRKDGGYIDRVPWLDQRGVPEENSNSSDTFVATAALTWRPVDNFSITPSVFFQQANRDDVSTYWTFGNGSNRPQPPQFQSGEGLASTNEDTSAVYSAKMQWDVGKASLISNTAYIDRDTTSFDDGTAYILDIFDGALAGALDPILPFIGGTGPLDFELGLPNCGECFYINLDMVQETFTQEFRIQSNDPDSPLQYVFGAFYADASQSSREIDISPNSPGSYLLIFPTGPTGIWADDYNEISDKQYALFGQVDWTFAERWTATAGLRYSRVEFDFLNTGIDPFTGLPNPETRGESVDEPVTPKFGIQYQANDDLMFYATAAKGFRAGGVNTAVDNDLCDPDLAAIGYDEIPKTYEADDVWSYELGTKGRIGNMMTFSFDVFTTQWDDIQRTRSLLTCVAIFTDNFGKASSSGFELETTIYPTEDIKGLSIDLGVSYVDAVQEETIYVLPGSSSPPGSTTIRKGDRFATPWTIATAINYETPVRGGESTGYGSLQYTYKSDWSTKPGNIGFNPVYQFTDAQSILSARVGIRHGDYDFSLFVSNLADADPIIGRLHFQPSERIQVQTYRPRTWGATLRYNF